MKSKAQLRKNKLQRGGYFSALSNGGVLDHTAVTNLLDVLREHLTLKSLPLQILKKSHLGPKITEELTRLTLYRGTGHRSWGGLVIGFPGTKRQLSAEYVGTPYLRRLLYPILDLHKRTQEHFQKRLPCVYILGERFPDVFLRKFFLLDEITPHVIIVTSDLLSTLKLPKVPKTPNRVSEAWVQAHLCQKMASNDGLEIHARKSNFKIGLLTHELPTWEGTKNPERLDILGYDKQEHTLVAVEIKGPACKRVELENLFLQGLEHRNWLERNKMAVKFIFDGPRGKRIDTRRRVRLVLGFFAERVPILFHKLRKEAKRKDRYLEIEFVRFLLDGESNLTLTRFEDQL